MGLSLNFTAVALMPTIGPTCMQGFPTISLQMCWCLSPQHFNVYSVAVSAFRHTCMSAMPLWLHLG